jgi:hypothetical protein
VPAPTAARRCLTKLAVIRPREIVVPRRIRCRVVDARRGEAGTPVTRLEPWFEDPVGTEPLCSRNFMLTRSRRSVLKPVRARRARGRALLRVLRDAEGRPRARSRGHPSRGGPAS